MSPNSSVVKQESFIVNSTNEKTLYLLVKESLSSRVFCFLEARDLLAFLNACKLKLRSKSKTLAHRVFVEATEPLISGALTSKGRLDKEVTGLLDAVQKINLFSFWNLFVQYEALKVDEDFNFNMTRKSCEELTIESDIGRTIPEKLKTEASKLVLKVVLIALSNSIPNLGYIQGLNSIVGLLTLGVLDLPELKSGDKLGIVQQVVYSNMKYFLVQRGFLLFYTDGFVRYRGLCIQLNLMMKAILPDIALHFVDKSDSGAARLRTRTANYEMVFYAVFRNIASRYGRKQLTSLCGSGTE